MWLLFLNSKEFSASNVTRFTVDCGSCKVFLTEVDVHFESHKRL